MAAEALWLTILLASGTILAAWLWRRPGGRGPGAAGGSAPPDQPCWTESVRGADGLSYGRYHCDHAQLREMEARVRSGEFATPC